MFSPITRILIADDMPGIRALMKQQLHQLGFRDIQSVEDGDDGLRLMFDEFYAEKPIQLVLSDWNMPRMSGIEFLRTLRNSPEFGDIPFLLVTAENEFSQVREAVSLRVSDYVVKPFTPDLLKKKLTAVWQRLKQAKPGAPK